MVRDGLRAQEFMDLTEAREFEERLAAHLPEERDAK
jgi:hypothetical protein